MTAPVDYRPHPSRPGASRRRIIAVALVLLVFGLLLFRPLLRLLIGFAPQGTSKSVAPADATDSVAASLMSWGAFGSVPDRDPGYTNLRSSIAARMTGINGFTESDGFHGDGTDWYELELEADLAAELRASFAHLDGVTKSQDFPRDNSAPPWWPTTWPVNAQCYQKDLEYLVLPDTGSRAWFLRIRT
jgi:hypothetical protein